MDITNEDIIQFEKLRRQRLQQGRLKYANMLHRQNMFKEITEELADVANYAALLYCKIKQIEKMSKKKLNRKFI